MKKLTIVLGTLCGIAVCACAILGAMIINKEKQESRIESDEDSVQMTEEVMVSQESSEVIPVSEESSIELQISEDSNKEILPPEPITEETQTVEPVEPIQRITGYEIIRDDRSYDADDRVAEWFFDIVQFNGEDSELCNTMNSDIQQIADEFFGESGNVEEEYSQLIGVMVADPYYSTYQFLPYIVERPYYDDTYVSIGWEQPWYAGGIRNVSWDCYNINIETMEHVTIYDILGDNAKEIIGEALSQTSFYEEVWSSWEEYDLNKLVFYFNEKDVFVCFKSYELHQTTGGGIKLTIPRNSGAYFDNENP